MKSLILVVVFFPALAFAGSTMNPMPDLTECIWGRNVREHAVIEYKDKRVCTQKICTHAVKCKAYTTYVNCPAQKGRCNGYSPDECVETSTQMDAEYDTAPRKK